MNSKAFVNLGFGRNELVFKTDNCTLRLVVYRAARSDLLENGVSFSDLKRVRVLYVICHDDPSNGAFQSNNLLHNNLADAIERISLNIKLLQTFISEVMYKHFRTRKTFALDADLDATSCQSGRGICETYYTKLSLARALQMTSAEIFLYLAEEIKQNQDFFDRRNCKYVAILSFTRYIPSLHSSDMFSKTKAYCAMGKW